MSWRRGSSRHEQGEILNPAKLTPARRDAICMQCHLEGSVAIEQPGKHIYDFKPGDDLSDDIHYLVLSTERQANPRAVSQFEALAQSMCQQKSGDAFHCTTCHDPHRSPAPAERVNYYRAYRELVHKRTQHARELYEAALQIDPLNIDAAVNLGVIEAQSGSITRALALWKEAFQSEPWRSSIGMNLAQVNCNLGLGEAAMASLRRVLQFNPDFTEASQFLRELESQTTPCTSR
jgi:tetratricopeptide (TPR) repeat protein